MFLLGVGTATTSCEDMFTADNNLVTTDLAPKDTLYQMMGILKSMQKLGDRTVLLGEIRADLIDIDPNHSSKDLQELTIQFLSTMSTISQQTTMQSSTTVMSTSPTSTLCATLKVQRSIT